MQESESSRLESAQKCGSHAARTASSTVFTAFAHHSAPCFALCRELSACAMCELRWLTWGSFCVLSPRPPLIDYTIHEGHRKIVPACCSIRRCICFRNDATTCIDGAFAGMCIVRRAAICALAVCTLCVRLPATAWPSTALGSLQPAEQQRTSAGCQGRPVAAQ